MGALPSSMFVHIVVIIVNRVYLPFHARHVNKHTHRVTQYYTALQITLRLDVLIKTCLFF